MINFSNSLMIAGLIALLGGALALTYPLGAGLTIEYTVGWVFSVVGVVALLSLFSTGFRGRGCTIFWGGLTLFAGISLLRHPLAGLATLTVILGFIFVLTGTTRLLIARSQPRDNAMWFVLISGVISLLIGVALLMNASGWAPFALGTLVAVELISSGIAMLSYGWGRRHATTLRQSFN